jgi:colicin import membrane protein
MTISHTRKYFFYSVCFHIVILLMVVLSIELDASLPVVENTHKNDIISAVVLGDSAKSKILPQRVETPAPSNSVKQNLAAPTQAKVIPLKIVKKPSQQEKNKAAREAREMLAQDLLSDIQKQKKIQQKKLPKQFAKSLHAAAEQTLRQQLLDENIKLKSAQLRESQGIVNKYQALILQAISEQWIVPAGANKHAYCQLMIRLAPGGTVLDVVITKSSGDPSLDRSARAAVFKASPLPVPDTAFEFQAFKQFVLKVKPENIV